MTIGLVCLFLLNNIAWAINSGTDDATLTPSLRVNSESFRAKFVLGEFALSVEGVKHFINGQVENEKKIFRRNWLKHRAEMIENIYDPAAKGRINGKVNSLRSVVFVKVAGLLASTGQAAFVDLACEVKSSMEFGGLPVVYIDSTLAHTPDMCVQRHEIDEIIQWEDFRQNVLKIRSNSDMARWIRSHLDSSDAKLDSTDYKGLNAIQIAELFHGYSYPLRDIYKYLRDAKDKGSAELDYRYISLMLQMYPASKTKGVNIAAKEDKAAAGQAPAQESQAPEGPFDEVLPVFTPIPPDAGPILAFGSSSTEGAGDHPLLSYPTLLERMIGHPVINSGIGGERIEGTPVYAPTLGVTRLAGELDRYHPSLLIIWHGRNDLLDGKDEARIGQALSQMIDEARRRNIQVLLLGSPRSGAFEDAEVYHRVALEKNVPYLREIYEDVLHNRERMADGIHANAEGNFIFAERICEYLRTGGALDTREGTAVLCLRTIYLIELVELLDRNMFLIQGRYSPDGKDTYNYNDKGALGFEGEHFDRPNYARMMDMDDNQVNALAKILTDIVRDRMRLGKLNDMKAHHPGDEAKLRDLTVKLGMKIPGFTAVSLSTGQRSAAPDLTDKHVLIVPIPPVIRPGTYEAIRSFYDHHREIVEPIYEEALEEFRGMYTLDQLMLEPAAYDAVKKGPDSLSRVTIICMLAHFLHVVAQYEVLRHEPRHPLPPDYVTGDSLGLETAIVLSGAMSRRDFMRFLRGRYELMPQITQYTYGRLIVPFVSPDQIQALLEPGRIEAVSYSNDNLATIVVRTTGKEETQQLAESIAQKMHISSAEIRVTFPVSRYVHHSFYGNWFNEGLKQLVDRISFRTPQIPIIDTSIDSSLHMRILTRAEEAKRVFFESILSTAYWQQALRLIQCSTNNQIWLSSTPESSVELRKHLRDRPAAGSPALAQAQQATEPSAGQEPAIKVDNQPPAEGRAATAARGEEAPSGRHVRINTAGMAGTEASMSLDEALTAQNIPDIENLQRMLNGIIRKQEKQGELRYYTVRYNMTKIPKGSLTEELLKLYVEKVLPMWLSGGNRVELKPSIAKDQSLVSIECYKNRSRTQPLGEGHVDVDEDISNKALRLIGMLNMAFMASQIPKDLKAEEAGTYDNIMMYIKAQYKDICGEELAVDLLKDTSKGIHIKLPRAAPVPLDKVDEYHRLTIMQLERSA